MADDYPFLAFKFDVHLTVIGPQAGLPSPLVGGAFAECDGLEMTLEPKVVREGGNNTQQLHLVGPVTYGNLTLKRGMTASLDLWNWFQAVAAGAGRGAEATATISLLDPSSTASAPKPVITFRLTGCLPIKIKAPALNAKDGQIAIEELQVAYSSFTITAGG
jgi:phage tail-like protein